MEEDKGSQTRQDYMSVSEAAEFLGLTEDAVRKRIHRGKIVYKRDFDGRYLVHPTETDKRQTGQQDYVQHGSMALISELRTRVELLENQLAQANERDRENRRLLAAALERIPPQLEAPAEPPQTVEQEPERGQPRSDASGRQEDANHSPWWRRVFGR